MKLSTIKETKTILIKANEIQTKVPVWRDRIRRLATDPAVMRSSPATDIYRGLGVETDYVHFS